MFLKITRLALLISSLTLTATAQHSQAPSERGAININLDGGYSFGFPANRAVVSVPGVGSAMSPEKKVLGSVGVGVGVRVWRFVVPFVDITALDTGTAFAEVGGARSEVGGNTVAAHGGVRLIGSSPNSRIRPYFQLGGGTLQQSLNGNFVESGRSNRFDISGSTGSVMYGFGANFFIGKRWGGVVGWDGFRLSQPMFGGGRNFSRTRIGLFLQTKSSIE